MSLNIPATKTNFLKLKKTLQMTKEGYNLLDEKRRILMNEVASVAYTVDQMRNEVIKQIKEAYDVVDRAVITMGRRRVEELAFAIDMEHDIDIQKRRIMGVEVPIVNLTIKENPPFYSPFEVNFYADEAIVRFKEALQVITKLAEKKTALIRLNRELLKTVRKVNALEKMHIPQYQSTLKTIADRLDEESRESFSMLKVIKDRMKG